MCHLSTCKHDAALLFGRRRPLLAAELEKIYDVLVQLQRFIIALHWTRLQSTGPCTLQLTEPFAQERVQEPGAA